MLPEFLILYSQETATDPNLTLINSVHIPTPYYFKISSTLSAHQYLGLASGHLSYFSN
jgi:hypothetical protein